MISWNPIAYYKFLFTILRYSRKKRNTQSFRTVFIFPLEKALRSRSLGTTRTNSSNALLLENRIGNAPIVCRYTGSDIHTNSCITTHINPYNSCHCLLQAMKRNLWPTRYVLPTPIQPLTRVKISLLFYQAFDAHLVLYYVRYNRSHVFNVRVF